jgi:hypothetical protein
MTRTRRELGRSLLLCATGAGLGLFALPASAADEQDASPPANGDASPLANVFISPGGRPFRAKDDAPYPVVDWFKMADKNADGRLERAEFVADSEAFFKLIDRNGDGVLSPGEVAFYEQRIAPEILGFRVEVSEAGVLSHSRRALLWRAQMRPPDVAINPGEDPDYAPRRSPQVLDESGAGASPFSFFDEPEPLMAADLNFRGLVFKADFLKLADIHFTTLDHDGAGFLTLATLPKTPMQKRLERERRGRRR